MKQLKVHVPARLSSPLARLAEEGGAAAVDTSVERDAQGRVWVTAYCEDAAAPSLGRRLRAELAELTRKLRLSEVPRVFVEDVRADWQTSWTQTLAPARIAPGLVLVAEGVECALLPGERLLRLEPGLYFGFGEHPTTQLISEWILEHCPERTVIDVGAGTGVLSFVAAFAGAKSVFGIDIDLPSVESAQRNAVNNGWQALCTFSSDGLEAVSGHYEVVLANIDAKTLTLLAADLIRVLGPNGRIALTGVLVEQAATVTEAFEKVGLSVDVCAERDGWVLLTNTPATSPLNE